MVSVGRMVGAPWSSREVLYLSFQRDSGQRCRASERGLEGIVAKSQPQWEIALVAEGESFFIIQHED